MADRSKYRQKALHGWRRGAAQLVVLSAVAVVPVAAPLYAQYPGHIDTKKKAAQTPRAIAVLEWTGEPGKPSASRMIPVTVFDGQIYQPGGLYLARPEPLAVEPGTEYILQQSGAAKGLFDVSSAQNLQGYWFGYGVWKPMAPPPKPKKLPPAKVMPHALDGDSDRPHFVRRDQGSNSQGSNSGSGSGTSSGGSSGSAGTHPPPVDPDRPTLRRRPTEDTASAAPDANLPAGAPETPIAGADPDRPRITRGAQNPTDNDFTPTKLSGTPMGLEQMVAVSDASDSEPRSFNYLWADAGDAAKMQSAMELLGQQAIAAAAAPPKPAKPAVRHAASTHPPARKVTAPPLPMLTDERFHAYELSYGSGATIVFTAQSTADDGLARYVTLVAQPDLYGMLHVIFKSVTDDAHLDLTPRMRLVDAVDARGNGRADLVFEVRGKQDRQFVIYAVDGPHIEQIFTTGLLPSSSS